MKKIKRLNKALFGIMGALGLGGVAVGGGILAYTNANVDQLDVLTRAVRDNTVEQYKTRAPEDIVVEIGDSFSVAIINDRLYAWGKNDLGQLGLGDNIDRDIPIEVTETSNGLIQPGTVTKIAVGSSFTIAIIGDKLYSWGFNDSGQLGLGGNTNRNTPTEVKTTSNGAIQPNTVTKIATGAFHATAVIDNRFYSWGKNISYQLGLGDNFNKDIPTELTRTFGGAPIQPGTVTEISNGVQSSSAIIDGELFTWGRNDAGELGIGSNDFRYRPDKVTTTSSGTLIQQGTVTQIAMGGIHSAAIIDGKLYMWGLNSKGQLGLNDRNNRNTPTEVKTTSNGAIQPGTIAQISLGGEHSAAIINDRLYTWGLNTWGQLGLGDQIGKSIPTEVTNINTGAAIAAGTVTQIVSADWNTAAIIGGKLYMWGRNAFGQLGVGPGVGLSLFPTFVTIDRDITLDSSTDPTTISKDIVYNIDEAQLRTLIGNSNSRLAIGILPTDTFNISPNLKNIGKLDATQKGQIALEVTVTSSNNRKINVKLNGFSPVNLTENVRIPPQVLTAADWRIFANDEINELVADANADTSGRNSKLAGWIIGNQVQFIGDTVTKYTPDFPKGANITKINNVEVVDGTKGEIRFQIEVNKYYKQDTPATDLIESTTADPVLPITSPITLSGFNTTPESKAIVEPGSDRNIVSAELLKLFGWVNNTTIITGQGLSKLNDYINLKSFPKNTSFKIINPDAGDKVLRFNISADRFYDAKGILVTPPAPEKKFPIIIDGLLNGQSKIEKIPNHPLLPASRILSDIGYDALNPRNPITGAGLAHLQQYVTIDLTKFPLGTTFILRSVDPNVPGQLSFEVVASNQYDSSGKATGTELSSGLLTFSNLPDSITSNITVKADYKRDVLSGDLENEFKQNGFNLAKVEEYVDFIGLPANVTYTFSNFHNRGQTLEFTIAPDATQTDGALDAPTRTFPIVITGLEVKNNSIDGTFDKRSYVGSGTDIANEIIASFKDGTKVDSSSPAWSLWNKLVDVNIYPPDTEFTINKITVNNHGGVFTTFEITVTANKHYSNNQTMIQRQTRAPFTIDYLKFNPTTVSKTTQALPNIKANEFLAYINYNDVDGSFNAAKLQEFVTFTGFDLSIPGTTTKLVVSENDIIDDKIPLTFEVLNYVDANGDGKNFPAYFTLPTFELDIKAPILPPVITNKSIETMILATSIAGGAFLLFLLLLLISLLIRRKRHMADHYIKMSGNNSGDDDGETDTDDGEYDQFQKDESDWTESSSKKA